jgi:flagellar assembly protein FliH
MLSKVFKASVIEVRPLVMREGSRAPVTHGIAPHRSEAPEELTERASVSELREASERQAAQAYETGFRAGAAAAQQKLEGEVRGGLAKLAEAVSEVAAARGEALRRAEADTVRLAVEVARRILHRELSTDPSALEALVKAALEKLQLQEIYRVRVHPGQEGIIKSCLEQAGRSQGVTVVPDPVQSKWCAVFEVSRGALDASVDTQLREIERGLTDQLENRA